jgi:hypothetical protein
MVDELCPRGHKMDGLNCSVCTYRAPAPPPKIDIRWGGRLFHFAGEREALQSGFHTEVQDDA